MLENMRFIGQDILRREDDYLLRGRGRFIDDLPLPANTLHLGFVLSPHAHARIVAINTAQAAALEGVVAVMTGEDMAEFVRPVSAEIEIAGYNRHDRNVIARDIVRFVGEAVAVVVCESAYIAQDALELVEVDYEILPALNVLTKSLMYFNLQCSVYVFFLYIYFLFACCRASCALRARARPLN